MKYILFSVSFIAGTMGLSVIAQEQIPTVNIKNKTNQELILIIGTQNIDKHTVIMRIKNPRTKKAVDYAYTVGSQIILNPEEDVSLYGLNVEEVQAINCYYTIKNMQKKVVARFNQYVYKTLYLKCAIKNGKVWFFTQEGTRDKTTDEYSLAYNIKDKHIKLAWPQNVSVITKAPMHMLDKVDDYVAIIPLERAAQQIYE